MIATAYVQNGAKVYISSRKEKQLKEVSQKPANAYNLCLTSAHVRLLKP